MGDTQAIREAMKFSNDHAADYRETPTSVEEARAMRQAAIAELAKIHEQSAKAKGLMKEHLKVESRKTMDRITGINNWVANHCSKVGSATRPSKAYEATLFAAAEMEICTCGATVLPERATEAWIFYCQHCGADWTTPAPRRLPPPPKRQPKRCKCDRSCRFCGGARGRR